MANLQERLKEIEGIVSNPKKMLDKYLGEGKKVVGCFEMYTPEEIAHAAGIIPMGVWGAQTELTAAKTYFPAFACSIMQSTLELGLNGKYKGLSAVMVPAMCDALRGVSQDWKSGVKDIKMIVFTFPQNRKIEAAVDYLIEEYNYIKSEMEAIAGRKVTDEDLRNSIKVYNEHNAVMREFAEVANDHLDIITPIVRHNVMKSAFFVEKGEHTKMVKDIIAGLKALPVHKWTGKRVVLTGITAEPNEFLKIFEDNNMAVVGDDVGQESRQFRTDSPECQNPMESLARQWKNRVGCSLAHAERKDEDRGGVILDLVKKNKADGVVVCMMKFCDPEEYDYPIFNKQLKMAGIPSVHIDIDQQTEVSEQARTRIQTFAEMI